MAGYVSAGSAMLGAVGHLANLGQFAEMGQNHSYQKENVKWARLAFRQDARALRLDLLNAIKEDIHDHYSNHAARIDTILLVNTLLFTFALATLQFSDQFVLQTEIQCEHCVEAQHPWLAYAWVALVACVLIFPFWSLVMAIWCKLQLDRWLQQVSQQLNKELRWALCERSAMQACAASAADLVGDQVGTVGCSQEEGSTEPGSARSSSREAFTPSQGLLTRFRSGRGEETLRDGGGEDHHSGGIINNPVAFVDEYQAQFDDLWEGECAWFVEASSCMLWLSAATAVLLTSLMFWIWLANREGMQNGAHALFALLMSLGICLPALWILDYRFRRRPRPRTADAGCQESSRELGAVPARERPSPARRSPAPRAQPLLSSAEPSNIGTTAQPHILRSVTEPPRSWPLGAGQACSSRQSTIPDTD